MTRLFQTTLRLRLVARLNDGSISRFPANIGERLVKSERSIRPRSNEVFAAGGWLLIGYGALAHSFGAPAVLPSARAP
jgi:hypothetical protein